MYFRRVSLYLRRLLKGMAQTVTGAALPTVVISDPENSSGRVTIQERNDYQSVVAYWFNEAEQRKVPAVAGIVAGAVSVYGDVPDNASEATEDVDSQRPRATSSARPIRIRRAPRKRRRN